jgi:flagellar protein FliS
MALPSTPRGPVNPTLLRSRYVNDSVDTMSPGRAIVALYDRLLLDLDRGEQAIGAGDIQATNDHLTHAQAIVMTLYESLDVERWPAGRNLAGLYVFVQTELMSANVEKDAARVASCRELVRPLRDAWRDAAGIVATRDGSAS